MIDNRLHLKTLSVLVMSGVALEREILTQVLSGFQVRAIRPCETVGEGKQAISGETIDLVIVGSMPTLNDGLDEFAFINWLRRHPSDLKSSIAILLLTGHTQAGNVCKARDCGASFVIAKPITAVVLCERMVWLARDPRGFVTSDGYCGPDRRFRMKGPPPGATGRRSDDLSLAIGEANQPNMSQAEIDAFLTSKGALK